MKAQRMMAAEVPGMRAGGVESWPQMHATPAPEAEKWAKARVASCTGGEHCVVVARMPPGRGGRALICVGALLSLLGIFSY